MIVLIADSCFAAFVRQPSQRVGSFSLLQNRSVAGSSSPGTTDASVYQHRGMNFLFLVMWCICSVSQQYLDINPCFGSDRSQPCWSLLSNDSVARDRANPKQPIHASRRIPVQESSENRISLWHGSSTPWQRGQDTFLQPPWRSCQPKAEQMQLYGQAIFAACWPWPELPSRMPYKILSLATLDSLLMPALLAADEF